MTEENHEESFNRQDAKYAKKEICFYKMPNPLLRPFVKTNLCVFLCALCALAVQCKLLAVPSASAQERPAVRVYFPNGEFVVAELALSGEERARGLMFRDDLAAEKGMLFVFEEEAAHSFWMKNVKFPIDMLWLDHQKRVVYMAKSVPPCRKDPCPTYSPLHPSIYVLELRAGRSDQLGLRAGDRIEFQIRR